MSLLVDISTQALDPAYADAAAARGAAGLTVIAVAGVQAHRHAPLAERSRQVLLDEVKRDTVGTDALQQRLDRLRDRIGRLRSGLLATTAQGAALTKRLAAQELAAGTIAATGPGLRVVADDAPNDTSGDNRVLDRDLQSIVNALWAAGAEAVAVDDQRLTAQSAIRQAGSAILVNFEPVPRPYVVTAIGDPDVLESRFAASAAADRMRSFHQLYGLRFGYAPADALILPRAPGLTLRYARPAERP
jgi:uncharacterized protein YlxW (UPF0749 family)